MTTYEDIIEAGIQLASQIDSNKWVLGDLANLVSLQSRAVADYAKVINCRARSLQDWSVMSAFYNPDDRENYPNLNYTHYRTARRVAIKQADHHESQLAIALRLLALASAEGWTCEQFDYEMSLADTDQFPAMKIVKIDGNLWERALAVIRRYDPELAQEMEAYL